MPATKKRTSKKGEVKNALNADTVDASYAVAGALAHRLKVGLSEQILSLIEENDLTLGVPLEARVKSIESVRDKIDRNSLLISDVCELNDLVGLRAIFLFKNELDAFQMRLSETFDVLSQEDTAERLAESQFGYQSRHIVLRVPPSWNEVPSFKGLGNLKAEIQIRTMAQHIWAAASHKLQYKREQGVPIPVRRAIHRVSALLETVDLEFLRVLEERRAYVDDDAAVSNDTTLNVDNLKIVLEETYPQANLKENEPYDKLLLNLKDFNITNTTDLRELLTETKSQVMEVEATRHKKAAAGSNLGTTKERTDKGVFFSHVGLAREAMRHRFDREAVAESIRSSF